MVRNTKNQNKSIKEAIIMKEQTSSVQNTGGLKPHLSSLAVWALSVVGLSCRYQQQLSFGGGTADIRSGTADRLCNDGACVQPL